MPSLVFVFLPRLVPRAGYRTRLCRFLIIIAFSYSFFFVCVGLALIILLNKTETKI